MENAINQIAYQLIFDMLADFIILAHKQSKNSPQITIYSKRLPLCKMRLGRFSNYLEWKKIQRIEEAEMFLQMDAELTAEMLDHPAQTQLRSA